MAVELARSYTTGRSTSWHTQANLRLVLNNNDQAKIISSKIAFEASMQRALLNQKYWDELLEKLRRAGGGGGSDPRFDKLTVSLQLMNFLSNKTIQAMLRNFINDFLQGTNNLLTGQITSTNIFVATIQKVSNVILQGIQNMILLIVRRDATMERLYNIKQQLSKLIEMMSFQLNKLKEILEEDLKEKIRKLDVKEKIKKIKTVIVDIIQKSIFSLLLRQEFHELHNKKSLDKLKTFQSLKTAGKQT